MSLLFPGPHGFTLSPGGTPLPSGSYFRLFGKSPKMSLMVSALVVAPAYLLAYYLALSERGASTSSCSS